MTTDSQGVAHSAYAGANAGRDIISANAMISGEHQYSNQLEVPWAIPAPPPASPPSSESGSEPPSVEIVSPQGDGILTGPIAVSAKITGEGITSWSATLTPAGGNAITLGTGSGTPPATLGTIEPSKLGGGTYTLSVTAATTGGSATETETLTIGTTPGLPPPPPRTSGGGAPTIRSVTPANGAVIGVTTTVSVEATPPEGGSIKGGKCSFSQSREEK